MLAHETIPTPIEPRELIPLPPKSRSHKRHQSSSNRPRDFVLDGLKVKLDVNEYNGLKDPHLQSHFYNKRLRRILRDNELITKEGQIIERMTCVKDISKIKSTDADTGFTYKPAGDRVLVVSVKLPRIIKVPAPIEVKRPPRRWPSMGRTSPRVETTSLNKSLNLSPGIAHHTEDVMQGRQHKGSKSPERQLLYFKAPETMRGSSVGERGASSERKSVDDKTPTIRKTTGTTGTTGTTFRDLKPMSNEELLQTFEKYKARLVETSMVVEEPEFKESGSIEAKQWKKLQENRNEMTGKAENTTKKDIGNAKVIVGESQKEKVAQEKQERPPRPVLPNTGSSAHRDVKARINSGLKMSSVQGGLVGQISISRNSAREDPRLNPRGQYKHVGRSVGSSRVQDRSNAGLKLTLPEQRSTKAGEMRSVSSVRVRKEAEALSDEKLLNKTVDHKDQAGPQKSEATKDLKAEETTKAQVEQKGVKIDKKEPVEVLKEDPKDTKSVIKETVSYSTQVKVETVEKEQSKMINQAQPDQKQTKEEKPIVKETVSQQAQDKVQTTQKEQDKTVKQEQSDQKLTKEEKPVLKEATNPVKIEATQKEENKVVIQGQLDQKQIKEEKPIVQETAGQQTQVKSEDTQKEQIKTVKQGQPYQLQTGQVSAQK